MPLRKNGVAWQCMKANDFNCTIEVSKRKQCQQLLLQWGKAHCSSPTARTNKKWLQLMCSSTCSIMTFINSNNMPFDLQRCILQYTSLWSILCVPLCCPSALCTMHFNNNKHRRLIQIGYWWSQVSATVGYCTIIPIAQHPWNIQLSRVAYKYREKCVWACVHNHIHFVCTMQYLVYLTRCTPLWNFALKMLLMCVL